MIDADWCWLMLIDAGWCRLMLKKDSTGFSFVGASMVIIMMLARMQISGYVCENELEKFQLDKR